MPEHYKRIEEYGLIGNLDTGALVGNDGSIDWFCTPHLESPSVFTAILDAERGGCFSIAPTQYTESAQSYIERTNVLRTHFTVRTGEIIVTDFMPVRYKESMATGKPEAIFRLVECNADRGRVRMCFEPRFDYARIDPIFRKVPGGIEAYGGDQKLFLQTPVEFTENGHTATASVTLRRGERLWLILQYENFDIIPIPQCDEILKRTISFWNAWAHDCDRSTCIFDGPWHDYVVRSGLVLKLLTHPSTGAIAAAPTTSLPEDIGGIRNWDYRYAWIRDASFTAQALYDLGHKHEALEYFHWFQKICERMKLPSEIQIMYTLHGEREIPEIELTHLSGYKNSRPVRIGNKAAKQIQLDIYGELIEAYFETVRYERDITERDWSMIRFITDYVCDVWHEKDYGIWEVRSEPKHFTYSKLMCWVAVDRSIRLAEKAKYSYPEEKWKCTRGDIRAAIIQRGFNTKLNSFVQDFDSEYLDATSLLIPMLEFLPFDDIRVQGTIDATIKYLSKDGFVYRYNGDDGLYGHEGAFMLCTFWLVDVLALSGRVEEAEALYLKVLDHISPLGLFAEEIDVASRHHLGNYPQGFSHIGLINSALYIGKAKGKQQIGPEPLGLELGD
jgi:alpha,alpha-trehalase